MGKNSHDFRILMTQKEMAVESGFSQQHISLILKGDRSVTIETAIQLENATGICREAWLLPERHWNPYVPFGDPDKCMVCGNRSQRLQHILKAALMYLAKHPTRKALQEVLDTIMEFIGLPAKRATFRMGVISGPLHFTLVYCGVVNEIVTAPVHHARDVPHVFMKAMKDGMVIVPYASEMLVDVPEEIALADKLYIKSYYLVISTHLALTFVYYDKPVLYTIDMLEDLRGFLAKLEEPLSGLIQECHKQAAKF